MSQPTTRLAKRTGANGITAGWTKAENKALARLYPTATRAKVKAALPGRSWNALGIQALALGLRRRRYWNTNRLKVLADYYPSKGAAYVAQLLDCQPMKVTKQASLQGIVRVYAAKPAAVSKPPKVPNPVKAQPIPRAKPEPKVVEPVAQHQPARLSNLIAQKSRKKKKETEDAAVSVTADYIKKLPYAHPERMAYTNGGVRGWQELQQKLKQAA
ncbi:MAG TPA: hypothetical protein VF690_04980 [Hymenobacter sp.]|jgi:hypothetical protein